MIKRSILATFVALAVNIVAGGTAVAAETPLVCVTNGVTTPSTICIW